MTFKLRYSRGGNHYHVRVFSGKDADHLALSGELVFEEPEFILFRGMLEHCDMSMVAEPFNADVQVLVQEDR